MSPHCLISKDACWDVGACSGRSRSQAVGGEASCGHHSGRQIGKETDDGRRRLQSETGGKSATCPGESRERVGGGTSACRGTKVCHLLTDSIDSLPCSKKSVLYTEVLSVIIFITDAVRVVLLNRVQKNPGFLKSPTWVVFLGFIGFYWVLGYIGFFRRTVPAAV